MRDFIFKSAILGALVLVFSSPLVSQESSRAGGTLASTENAPVRLFADYTGPYTMIERSDWSRYDNGKYIGHVYHEVRASIKPESSSGSSARPAGGSPGSFRYRGNFFVLEETLRDMRQSARPVDAIVPVSFRVDRDGSIVLEDDRGYPSFRGFPAFPAEAVRPGSKWVAEGSRAVDPLNSGTPVVVPLIAEYEYRGVELYRNIQVHRISAKYAMRYRNSQPSFSRNPGDPDLFSGLQGSHTVDILIKTADGLPLLIRDNMDETFSWPDGSTVRFKGFTLIFSEGVMPVNRNTMIASIGNTLGIKGSGGSPAGPSAGGSSSGSSPQAAASPRNTPQPGKQQDTAGNRPANAGTRPAASAIEDLVSTSGQSGSDSSPIDLVSVPEGIRLVIKDIRFIPDSDEFLPEERPRLDMIAEALKLALPHQNFLIEGHTASLGKPAGEQQLSVQRAKRMVDELAKRGISESRFIYKGWGGTKPVGDNSNEAGRRLNRRVEITILE
jgi:outer membrane protein OmpA-like peptidoglycan-associated protein